MNLRDAIMQHVTAHYDGNVSEFARTIGVPYSVVTRWSNGRIARPSIEGRRTLARALGLRHVDILVLTGDLDPGEVGKDIAPVERSEVDELLARLPAESQQAILGVIRDQAKTHARLAAASQPARVEPPAQPAASRRS